MLNQELGYLKIAEKLYSSFTCCSPTLHPSFMTALKQG